MSIASLTLFTFMIGGGSSALAAMSLIYPSSIDNPYHKPLSQDFGFNSSFDYRGKNTFGWKYRNYMIGQGKQNKRWWQKSFENLKQDSTAGDSFKVAKEAWWFNGDEALNRICRKSYLGLSNVIEKGDTHETDIWKYCSILGSKPIKVKDDESKTDNTFGKTLKDHLISTTEQSNDKFWKIRNDEFFFKLGRRSQQIGTFFQSFLNGKETDKTIKEKCQEAYQKQTSSSELTSEEVKRYCGFEDFLP